LLCVKDACKPGGSAKRAEKEQELASSTIFTEPASNNEGGQDYGGYDIVKATQVIYLFPLIFLAPNSPIYNFSMVLLRDAKS
jgi:hypothetical protein